MKVRDLTELAARNLREAVLRNSLIVRSRERDCSTLSQ